MEEATQALEVATIERDVEPEVASMLAYANALVIDSHAKAQEAAENLNECKSRKKRVMAWFDPLCQAADNAHKTLTRRRSEVVGLFDKPISIISRKLAAHDTEQDQARAAHQRAVEQERQRLIEEARLARAAKAEAEGKHDLADRILEGKVPEPVVVVPVGDLEPEKLEGVSFVERWKAEVVDLAALVRAVAAGVAPVGLVVADQVALNRLAGALKGAMDVPGVRAVCDKTVRGRGK